MTPIPLVPAAGDGLTTVFTAPSLVTNELFLVDRLPQIAGTDYVASVVLGVSVYTFAVAPPVGAILTVYPLTSQAAGASSQWDTAGNIINDAAVECGLSAVADPFASSDPNFIRLCKLLKSCGKEIVNKADWTHLDTEYLWTTVLGQQTYPMPPDFRSMYDQSGWVRNTRLPLGGPLSPQEWQFVSARLVGVTWTVLFRPALGNIQAFPPQGATPNAMQVAFEYRSNWWVGLAAGAYNPRGAWAPNTAVAVGDTMTNGGNTYACVRAGVTSNVAGATGPNNFGTSLDGSVVWKFYLAGTGFNPSFPTASAPSSSSDLVYLDALTVMRRLKWAFLQSTGFDYEEAKAEYLDTLADAMGNDKAAPVLRLGQNRRQDPLLTTANLPLTGYG